MSRRPLSEETIAARMVELRNLRMAHGRDRRQIAQLRAENKQLLTELTEAKHTIATLQIQIAELQTMVFGKKKHPPTGTTVPVAPAVVPMSRTKASYRRPIPPLTAITHEVSMPLPGHCACGGVYKDSVVHVHYEEDIPLPELTPNYQAHLVTRQIIESGVCERCGTAASAQGYTGQAVTLGPNVRLLVAHLVSASGLSYQQVRALLLALYGLKVSDGEIATLLQKQHTLWLPAYYRLQNAIRAAPIRHYDETPWHICSSDNNGYAWVMSDDQSGNTLFRCATSRGTRHAAHMHGRALGVYITDDYGVYRHLSGQQQLCWAHLYRVIRDLRYNEQLPELQQPSVVLWYESFSAIYDDLRVFLRESYDKTTRRIQAAELWRRVAILAHLPAPLAGEPERLRRLKGQLLRAGKDRLFTCLIKDTPCDNNRAERDLRQLVLKRKRSFGSKTEKGAQAFATILSICTTTWRSNPQGYFKALAAIG